MQPGNGQFSTIHNPEFATFSVFVASVREVMKTTSAWTDNNDWRFCSSDMQICAQQVKCRTRAWFRITDYVRLEINF